MIPKKGLFYCPQCSSSLEFKSLDSVYLICPDCFSIIEKADKVDRHGKTLPVLEDMTPIKIGTKGKFNNKAFEVIGRTRFERNDGYFNQWNVLFSDETIGLLGEGFGEYSLYFKQSFNLEPQKFSNCVPPKTFTLPDKKEYKVVRVKENLASRSEGEILDLYFDSEFISIELGNSVGEMAILKISSTKGIVAFTGKNYEFGELSFTNLRDLNGWY